jgi:peptidoglycan/LPS O-acetylase OafA/YrhL
MKRKIEVIDFLRGIAILAIVIIHIVAFRDRDFFISEYIHSPFLFTLREILQFAVITIVLCSGFSLYNSNKNLSFKKKDLHRFFLKRVFRLLIPWWVFLAIFFAIHSFLNFCLNLNFIDLTFEFVFSSLIMVGGTGMGLIILLLLFLGLLFPLLKFLYDNYNKKIIFGLFFSVYMALFLISIFFHKIDIYNIQLEIGNLLPYLIFILILITGWSFVYMLGFLLNDYYNKHTLLKKEWKLIIGFFAGFIIFFIFYYLLNLDTSLHLNKAFISPLYLFFGLLVTFFLLTLFFAYRHFIHNHLMNFFTFFSSNSYWIYIWSILVTSIVIPFLTFFSSVDIYVRFVIASILIIFGTILLVVLQKKLIKIKMYLEKHHF